MHIRAKGRHSDDEQNSAESLVASSVHRNFNNNPGAVWVPHALLFRHKQQPLPNSSQHGNLAGDSEIFLIQTDLTKICSVKI